MDDVEIDLNPSDTEIADVLDYQLPAPANAIANNQNQSSKTGETPAKRPGKKAHLENVPAGINQSNG